MSSCSPIRLCRQSSFAIVQPRWGNRRDWATGSQGARQSRDPGLWNATPLAYRAVVGLGRFAYGCRWHIGVGISVLAYRCWHIGVGISVLLHTAIGRQRPWRVPKLFDLSTHKMARTMFLRMEQNVMHRSLLANLRIGLYANGVAFHSPGCAARRGAPWGHNPSRHPNPNGVLQPHCCTNERFDIGRCHSVPPSGCADNHHSPLSNPVGVIAAIGRRVPRVRGKPRPWAMEFNAVGV